MKHIILAGSSRCGKTTLAMKFRKYGYVHYKMDSIKRGIDNNFWKRYQSDWKVVSPYMAHLINQMILDNKSDIVRNKEYYFIDTCHLYPKDIIKYNLDDVIIVFVGYNNLNIDKKIKDIRKYDKKTWSKDINDEDLKDYLISGIEYSNEVKKECEKYNIKYFDTGKNFKKVIKEVEKYLLSKMNEAV